MNHPGFYKDKSLEFSFHSDLNLEKIGKRKNYYSSILKKDEVKNDFPYMNLNDLDQVEKIWNYLILFLWLKDNKIFGL